MIKYKKYRFREAKAFVVNDDCNISDTRMRIYPKLLFITANTMFHIRGSSLLFKTLLKNIPDDRLCWAVAGGWSRKIPSWMQNRARCVCTSFLLHRNFARLARQVKPFRFLWCWYAYRWFPARAAKKIVRFAYQQGIEKLWVQANGLVIPVAVRLKKFLNLPLHLSIHDDIATQLPDTRVNWLRSDFEELLHGAASYDVISDFMCEYYKDKYDTSRKVEVILIGDDTPIPSPPLIRPRINKIGYAGSIVASDCMKILLAALAILNDSRIKVNQIKLKVISSRFPKHLGSNTQYISYAGALRNIQIDRVLQDCDLLYVPMSFLVEREIFCRTSLPSKILTYMQAQIPLLAHGPTYASNINFVAKYDIGMTSTAIDPEVLAQEILEYENNSKARIKASQRCRFLSKHEFNPEKVWERLRRILFDKS